MSTKSDHNVELRLRAAVESAPSGLLMIDPAGRIVLVNREVERLFGYPREELLGQSVDVLVPERLREQHATHRAGFFASPSVRAMGEGRDLFGLTKDGREVPVEIGLTPVVTEEGLFVLSSVVDISARKRAEARFRTAVESSPNGMVMVDADGRIVLVNREVENLFGYQREELLGRSIDLLVPQRFRTEHPEFRKTFFANPGARAMGEGRDLFGVRKDGKEVPVEIGLNPIETEDGLFVLSSIVDISARVAAEEEKRRLKEQLVQSQKMESLGTLAGGVAHDFNNVLGGILSYAELLQETVDERHQGELEELIGFAHRGKEVVDRILAFSRRQEPARRPVALDRIIAEATRLLHSSLPPNIEVRVDIQAGLPMVYADPGGIHQMLLNLGMNAAHAMPGGGVLEFGAEKAYVIDSVARRHPQLNEGEHALLRVRDTGEGMSEEVQQRVFEPFFTTKKAGQGSGLGMAIVHRIVEENQGGLELQSAVGQGTTFECYLPIVEVEEEEPRSCGNIGLGKGQRVLLVDDDPLLAKVGLRRLDRLGYTPTVVSDSRKALELFSSDPSFFAAVVTDYLMPGMNGIELGTEISSLRPGMPILMLTGYIEDFDPDTVRNAGITRLLQKPLSLRALDMALADILSDGALPQGSSEPH